MVSIDLDFLEGKETLLVINLKCVVIGLGDMPYVLYATPQFTLTELPQTIQEDIYKVKRLVIQNTFLVDPQLKTEFCSIPGWVSNFTELEYVTLENVDLNKLEYLRDLPIQTGKVR